MITLTFPDISEAIRSELTNCIYLEDSSVTVYGIKIYGTPWQPEFCGWAFNLPRGKPPANVLDCQKKNPITLPNFGTLLLNVLFKLYFFKSVFNFNTFYQECNCWYKKIYWQKIIKWQNRGTCSSKSWLSGFLLIFTYIH